MEEEDKMTPEQLAIKNVGKQVREREMGRREREGGDGGRGIEREKTRG